MNEAKHKAISESLALIFKGIDGLKREFEDRLFTIDGRLVGDVGEVIAALHYELILDSVSQPNHDATTFDNRRVQIKATFQDSLTFRSVPDFYLGIKLNYDGTFTEIYNGPGNIIFNKFNHRKGIGLSLLSFPNKQLMALSKGVSTSDKISKRVT